MFPTENSESSFKTMGAMPLCPELAIHHTLYICIKTLHCALQINIIIMCQLHDNY